MKTLTLALVAMAALAVPLANLSAQDAAAPAEPAANTTATQVAKLKAEVDQLKSLVEELSAEVAKLKAEVAALKAAGPVTTAEPPKPEVVTEKPTAKEPTAATGTHGKYELDSKDLEGKLIKMIEEQAGPMLETMEPEKAAAQLEQWKTAARAQAAMIKVDLLLDTDGKWTSNFSAMGDAQIAHGTWKQDGEKITFTYLWENGGPLPEGEPKVVDAKVVDGNLVMRPQAEMPFDLVMKKKD